jgi:hypothetical protein
MVRILLAGLAGAVTLFVFGMLSWMVLPLHMMATHHAADEDIFIAALDAQLDETGVYFAPNFPEDPNDKAGLDVMIEKHERGPVATVFYRAEGAPVMPPSMMGLGFLLQFLSASLAALLLSRSAHCLSTFGKRLLFVTLLGVFVTLQSDLQMLVWMYSPTDWTIAMVFDMVVGWFFAGLVIAAIVKPRGNLAVEENAKMLRPV